MHSMHTRIFLALITVVLIFPSLLIAESEKLPSITTVKEIKRDGYFIAYNDGTVLDMPIPLISPPDSEGKRHAIPVDVATLFRIMSPLRGRSEATLVFGCLS